MPFPIPSFGDVAADFAGAQGLEFGAGPSASGDITSGAVDFGNISVPGITRGFNFNNPVFLIGAAVITIVIFSVLKK